MLTPSDILREPPFVSVVQHMQITTQAVERLRPLFDALRAGDEARVGEACREIADLEEAADQLKNLIRDHLPRNIRLPVSRRDLLTVVSAQDSISDDALRIVWLLEVRRFTVPDEIAGLLLTFVDDVIRTVQEGQELCDLIVVLAESRFAGPRLAEAMALIARIEESEAACDLRARETLRALFAAEEHIGPVDTILWDRIVDLIGALADGTKKLANRVRLMLAR